MKDKYGDEARLKHILESIENIFLFLNNIKLEELAENREKRNAIIYEFIIIGEASKHVSDKLKSKYPKAAWKMAYNTRNKLVHEYPHIQAEILFKAAVK